MTAKAIIDEDNLKAMIEARDRIYASAETGPVITPVSATAPGTKHDGGKPAMALLSAPFLKEMGAVMEYGARKYALHNWRKGIGVTRLLSAAFRHMLSWMDGTENDPESGLHHLAHAAVDLMMAAEEAMCRPSFDDRFLVRKETGPETAGE